MSEDGESSMEEETKQEMDSKPKAWKPAFKVRQEQ